MKSIERCEYFEFYWIDKSIAKYILYIKKKKKNFVKSQFSNQLYNNIQYIILGYLLKKESKLFAGESWKVLDSLEIKV